MFKPRENRLMRILDRSFFKQRHEIAAARILRVQDTNKILKRLAKSDDVLNQPKVKPVQDPPAQQNGSASNYKCVLLKSEIKHDDRTTWSEAIDSLVNEEVIDIMPYTIELDYENWDRGDIMGAILPEELLEGMPDNYNGAGHLAQVALKPPYLPYKYLIGQIFIDKTAGITTVINKVGSLDDEDENVFRTLNYELIAGEDNMFVEVVESACRFRFDYSKAFWNSKLGSEHERLAAKFAPGEAICDVMAGVGPFAIPAARKGVFVWANDINPNCYEALVDGISLNKVSGFVRPFNQDGHAFIPSAARALLETPHEVQIPIPAPRRHGGSRAPRTQYRTVIAPRTFAHYIMNLPSTAPDFLPAFRGLYAGNERLFRPHTATPLPMVHCYCFVRNTEGPREPRTEDPGVLAEVCARVSRMLGGEVRPDDAELEVHDVRKVAPRKAQMCVSFRLPAEVAFAGA